MGAEFLAEAEIDGVVAGELLDIAPVVRILLVGFMPAARRDSFDLARNDRDFRRGNREIGRSLPGFAFIGFGSQLIRAARPDGVIFSQLLQRFSPLACFLCQASRSKMLPGAG